VAAVDALQCARAQKFIVAPRGPKADAGPPQARHVERIGAAFHRIRAAHRDVMFEQGDHTGIVEPAFHDMHPHSPVSAITA